MHPVIAKTFGGLSPQYYFRQMVFGILLTTLIYFMESAGPYPLRTGLIVLMVINTLLYPYSRFVYERIVNFVMGQNVLFVNVFLMLFVKLITMLLCWAFALFIAPVGLIYLYFYHSKVERQKLV